jgi:hypothetical protein
MFEKGHIEARRTCRQFIEWFLYLNKPGTSDANDQLSRSILIMISIDLIYQVAVYDEVQKLDFCS